MRVFLIGYMGSGKSTLGRQLAKKMGYAFVDMDQVIEQKEGCSVQEIFVRHGEAFFRELEHHFLATFNQDDVVVSTGGGAPCFYDNILLINTLGESIYLKVPPPVLVARLQAAKGQRPLLAGKSKEEMLEFVTDALLQREPYYCQSTHIIEGIGINVNDIINALNLKK